MQKSDNTTVYSATEIQQLLDNGASQTDYSYTDNLSEKALEKLRLEDDNAAMPLSQTALDNLDITVKHKKKPISIRLDEDVLEWFRADGRGYQTTINTILRTYMISKESRATYARHGDSN